jgi:chemotaxis signal transduction protein
MRAKTEAKAIDWNLVRKRLDASNQALALALEPDDGVVEAIRRHRAAYLATRSVQDVSQAGVPVLVIAVEGKRYAVDLEHLAEITGSVVCTPVPGLAGALLGLTSLHGEIRPVLDLVSLLGIPRQGAADRKPGAVVFLRGRQSEIGIAVQKLEGLKTLDASQLETSVQDGAGMPRRYIKAITRDMLAVIDIPALLAGAGIGLDP